MPDTYVTINNGAGAPFKEEKFIDSSAGAESAGKPIALNSEGKIPDNMLPTNLGTTTDTATASEALSADNLVNIYYEDGKSKVRKADASGGFAKRSCGFVKAAYASGSTVTIYKEGIIPQTGLTADAHYYLSDVTPGGVQTSKPITTGFGSQYVGYAKSETELVYEPGLMIIRS